jgi:hypothetical protein
MHMIVQVYAIVEGAIETSKAGADNIGFLVGKGGVVSASLGREMCRALPQKKRVMMPILRG